MNSSTNLTASTPADPTALTELRQKLASAPEKTQLQLITEVGSQGEPGLTTLMGFLLERQAAATNGAGSPGQTWLKPDLVMGKAYQLVWSANTPQTQEFLQTHFPEGLVPLRSPAQVDYRPLQKLLAEQNWQAADQLTLQKLCELAGPTATQRKWIYFTEVEQLPAIDLQIINALWLVHSEGRFGFSVQRDVWLSVGKNWDKLWTKIGWKSENNWTRYPQEFTWDLTAPLGHLPLSNQLRGVRVIASLLSHPAWTA
ncbi:GUN4 N-terminal ARM-like repeat domain-containing protein [Pantanalinema rosaneae CENA516]|uniref:GUN4 N-terminal ARM-like repeat domain-containing protein n=1 Tax=Pantanalinema rosaneae TaxID=1620701 RepID=UPI003D6FC6E4